MSVDVKYRTSATATVTGGRDGQVRSEDGNLEVRLATPKELGGPGETRPILNSCLPLVTLPVS
jgi:organic hydroperoxide reductase OsmC/OhrA